MLESRVFYRDDEDKEMAQFNVVHRIDCYRPDTSAHGGLHTHARAHAHG